jgi:hypothetical protein
MSPWQQIAVMIADTLSCELWMVGHGREFNNHVNSVMACGRFWIRPPYLALSCTTVRLSTFDRQRRPKEVGIGETLKSAKREPFWATSNTLPNDPE